MSLQSLPSDPHSAARPYNADAFTLSAAEYRLLVEHSPVMIWRSGGDGKCDYFNETWLTFTGRSLEQEIGDGWVAGVHPDDVQECLERYLDAFHKRKPFEIEYRLLRSDGVYRWIVDRGTPLIGEQDAFIGYVGSCVDVEERRQAGAERERLRQAEADLAYMNRVLTMGELAASIAHEVKQPISAAIANGDTCTRLLDRPHPDLGVVREVVADMSAEVRRASDIVDRIRSLYTRGAPRRDTIQVNELVREMVALLSREALTRGVSVRTELETPVPPVTGDRVQLQQVLLNLMLNGIEASKGAPGELVIQTRREGDRGVLIAVSDSGIGLPREQAERVFDAFFTTKPQGTGMGLAISRAIVEAHGGSLWAVENPTAGATFQFTVPN